LHFRLLELELHRVAPGSFSKAILH
jgi:hypothetical protein